MSECVYNRVSLTLRICDERQAGITRHSSKSYLSVSTTGFHSHYVCVMKKVISKLCRHVTCHMTHGASPHYCLIGWLQHPAETLCYTLQPQAPGQGLKLQLKQKNYTTPSKASPLPSTQRRHTGDPMRGTHPSSPESSPMAAWDQYLRCQSPPPPSGPPEGKSLQPSTLLIALRLALVPPQRSGSGAAEALALVGATE